METRVLCDECGYWSLIVDWEQFNSCPECGYEPEIPPRKKTEEDDDPTYNPRVLVACEFSGIVRDAFTAKGWDAYSCDLLPTAYLHLRKTAMADQWGEV